MLSDKKSISATRKILRRRFSIVEEISLKDLLPRRG